MDRAFQRKKKMKKLFLFFVCIFLNYSPNILLVCGVVVNSEVHWIVFFWLICLNYFLKFFWWRPICLTNYKKVCWVYFLRFAFFVLKSMIGYTHEQVSESVILVTCFILSNWNFSENEHSFLLSTITLRWFSLKKQTCLFSTALMAL